MAAVTLTKKFFSDKNVNSSGSINNSVSSVLQQEDYQEDLEDRQAGVARGDLRVFTFFVSRPMSARFLRCRTIVCSQHKELGHGCSLDGTRLFVDCLEPALHRCV